MTNPLPMTTHPEAALARASDTEPVAWQWSMHGKWYTVTSKDVSDPEAYAKRVASGTLGETRAIYTADALATARAEGRAEGMRGMSERLRDLVGHAQWVAAEFDVHYAHLSEAEAILATINAQPADVETEL